MDDHSLGNEERSSTLRSAFGPRSLWLKLQVEFTKGRISGDAAPEAWEGAIKESLKADTYQPNVFDQLYRPIASRIAGAQAAPTNFECGGLLVCQGRGEQNGSHGLELKFLGEAARFAPRVIHALATRLSAGPGVGSGMVRGRLVALHAFSGGGWIARPLPFANDESAFESYRAVPAALGGWAVAGAPGKRPTVRITLRTTSRWILRSKGKLAESPPSFGELVKLAAERVARVEAAWGNAGVDKAASLRGDETAELVECHWRRENRILKRAKPDERYSAAGFAGSLTYSGAVSDTTRELLHAASFLHIGQRTSLGLGGFSIEYQ